MIYHQHLVDIIISWSLMGFKQAENESACFALECPCKSTSKDSVPTHQTEIIPGKTRGGGSPVQDEDGDDNDLSTT